MANEQQCKRIAEMLTEHSNWFGKMSDDDCDWTIQNPGEAIGILVEGVHDQPINVMRRGIKRLPGTLPLPAMKRFVAKDNFIVDTSEKARVRIVGLDMSFIHWFLPKIENDEVVAEELVLYETADCSYDPLFITILGGEAKVKISLGQFFTPFTAQPNGENGPLLANEVYVNVAYIDDINGVLRAVCGFWVKNGARVGWYFGAGTLGFRIRWGPDYRRTMAR